MCAIILLPLRNANTYLDALGLERFRSKCIFFKVFLWVWCAENHTGVGRHAKGNGQVMICNFGCAKNRRELYLFYVFPNMHQMGQISPNVGKLPHTVRKVYLGSIIPSLKLSGSLVFHHRSLTLSLDLINSRFSLIYQSDFLRLIFHCDSIDFNALLIATCL